MLYLTLDESFDARQVFEIDTPASVHKPMYMLVNLAIGGSWPGAPKGATPFPAEYAIDYIRAYSHAPQNVPAPVVTLGNNLDAADGGDSYPALPADGTTITIAAAAAVDIGSGVATSGPKDSAPQGSGGGTASALIDVYRFYNTATGTHFYTGSATEKNDIVANPGNDPYLAQMNFEQPAYKALGQKVAGSTELYRFYNTATGSHFFTAAAAEKDHIVGNPGNDPFLAAMRFEGTAYYVLGQDGPHAVEVWRFYNTATGVHFFTASEAEKAHIVDNPSSDPYLAGLVLEGVGFWAPDALWGA